MKHRKQSDRRATPRADMSGSAYVVVGGTRLGPYRVDNLSAGGALLSDGPKLRVQTEILVRLELYQNQPIELAARVVRCHLNSRAQVFALSFDHESADSEDMLHDIVLEHLERHLSARQQTG